jgi:hypothetical protein
MRREKLWEQLTQAAGYSRTNPIARARLAWALAALTALVGVVVIWWLLNLLSRYLC